jgi:predicted SAM-dependent methyltransferase
MNVKKQVDKSHYEFSTYMTKARWCSVWHQIDEIQKLKPINILEIGPGPGILKTMLEVMGFSLETLDIDPEIKPNHVGSVTEMSFKDSTYDVVCAFQMLEHLPYEYSLKAFSEMARVSRKNVLISLPDSKMTLQYKIYLPRLGSYDFLVPHPRYKPQDHQFDGEHYWEINKKGYSLQRVIADLSVHAQLIRTYQVFENPYHRFFLFKKIGAEN